MILFGTIGMVQSLHYQLVGVVMRFIDQSGKRFHMLVARRHLGGRRYEFLCDCGKEHIADIGNVKMGRTTSCGCFGNRVKVPESHGMHGTPEYSAWRAMITRATNPNTASAARYIGRGITVSDEWRHSFADFYSEVGPRPSPGHSLDRIDNDKGYQHGNVRWATNTQQMLNRSNNNLLTVKGVTKAMAEWARETGIGRTTLDARRARGVPVEHLFDPIESRYQRRK